MGNSTSKQTERDISCPDRIWDDVTERPKYVDSKAKYVFNFYGEYSREEFLKANVDDPEFEKEVKEYVDHRQYNPIYINGCRSTSTSIHHNGTKYGIAWHNMLFVDPLCTITLMSCDNEPLVKIYRFMGNNTLLTIKDMQKQTKVTWDHKKADVTARYVCDLVGNHEALVVENDLGLEETKTILRGNDELQHTLEKLIDYMTCINKKPKTT